MWDKKDISSPAIWKSKLSELIDEYDLEVNEDEDGSFEVWKQGDPSAENLTKKDWKKKKIRNGCFTWDQKEEIKAAYKYRQNLTGSSAAKPIVVDGFQLNQTNLGVEDESGSNGLWDMAGQVAVSIGLDQPNSEGPIFAEEWGQERIYVALRNIVDALLPGVDTADSTEYVDIRSIGSDDPWIDITLNHTPIWKIKEVVENFGYTVSSNIIAQDGRDERKLVPDLPDLPNKTWDHSRLQHVPIWKMRQILEYAGYTVLFAPSNF